MKTDFYTKTILTVIAICLTILTLHNVDIIPKAFATESNKSNVTLGKNYGLVPLNDDGSINVKITSSQMDVNIVEISTSDELDVNIDEIGGGYVSHGGPIAVDVQ